MMYYLPLLIVCSLSSGYVGDADTGPTCIRLFDSAEIHYQTHTQCADRLREMVEDVKGHRERLEIIIPGPWHYKGQCIIPTIDEKIA